MKYLFQTIAIFGIVFGITVVCFTWLRVQRGRADRELLVAGNVQTVMLRVNGMERRTLIHLPPSYSENSPLPLVLMFHGAGGTPEAAIRETGWLTKADLEGFIVAFPEASRPDMTRRPQFGVNNPTWNDGSGRFHSGEQKVPDVAFIAALLGHLERKFAVDRQCVYAAGFSNGASMAFRVGRELSEHFAAIAPVSGALWPSGAAAVRPVSVLYLTGTADPLNPMEGGVPKMASGSSFGGSAELAKPPVAENIRAWAELIGASPTPEPVRSSIEGITTLVHGGGRDGTEVVFTTIGGHGHIWPGAGSPLPEFMVGRPTSRISATDVIWDFFSKHSRGLDDPDRLAQAEGLRSEVNIGEKR